MKNIVLIGMPASGKSTIGVILAKELKYRFTDTDLIIQEKNDKTLIEIIESSGLESFLNIEDEILATLHCSKNIIATGGSAVYGNNAMTNLKNEGIIIYLRLRYEVIKSRLNNIETRGVAMKSDQSLLDLYNERIPLYEKWADITIDADGLTTEQTVQTIIAELRR